MDANDQLSIKNLLFTKAIPNYVIPVPTAGHKIYACTDCGDKFIISSSYDDHINRKSVKISYNCRHCNVLKIFYNRCNLLSHIRSHAFKTATINVSDLKLDPLPLKFYNRRGQNAASTALQKTQAVSEEDSQREQEQSCTECKAVIQQQGADTSYESRVKHYMQKTNETHTCPLCLFTFSTTCALKLHLRCHFKISPYICPECGKQLSNRNLQCQNYHNCENFMMMKATVRLKCPVPDCHLIHPNEFRNHLKDKHLKTVYKCPFCYVACFEEAMIAKHLKNHTMNKENCLTFFQCEMCPGKLVLQSQIETHFKSHMNYNYMFPCWVCGKIFKDVFTLTIHHMDAHFMQDSVKNCIQCILNIHKKNTEKKKIYRVVKRCDQCKRSFCYKCKFEHIKNLPIECPFKCTTSSGAESSALMEDELLTCHLCKNKMSQKWEEIKKHFHEFHKTHRCVDINVMVPRINIEKYLPIKNIKTLKNPVRKRRTRKKRIHKNEVKIEISTGEDKKRTLNIGEFACKICLHVCNNKELLEKHLLIHRDPCMAYQCMECGQCFVVKPSFSKHLILEHNISKIDDYINEKQCYNESALMKYQDTPVVDEPLRENQCNICREQFDISDDLEKHFRVHGMAFLMKNNSNKTISP